MSSLLAVPFVRPAALLLAAASLAACTRGEPTSTPPAETAAAVPAPAKVTFWPHGVLLWSLQQYPVKTYLNDFEHPTTAFRWQSSDTTVVVVDQAGVVAPARHSCDSPPVRVTATLREDARSSASFEVRVFDRLTVPTFAGVVRAGTTTPVDTAAVSGVVDVRLGVLTREGCLPISNVLDIRVVEFSGGNTPSRLVLSERRTIEDPTRENPVALRLNTLATDSTGARAMPNGRYVIVARLGLSGTPESQLAVWLTVRNP